MLITLLPGFPAYREDMRAETIPVLFSVSHHRGLFLVPSQPAKYLLMNSRVGSLDIKQIRVTSTGQGIVNSHGRLGQGE